MKVYGTICMMPDRYPKSLSCVMSLKGQVEKLYLCLNGFDSVPKELNEDWIEVLHVGKNYGDAARFFMLPDIDGHLISCDDDLIYPKAYVSDFIKIHASNPGCVLSHHGKQVHGTSIQHVSHCLKPQVGFSEVNMPGSGCSFFPSEKVKLLRFNALACLNMSDVHLYCLLRGTKILTCPRPKDYLKYVEPPKGTTVWDTVTSKSDFMSKFELVVNSYSK